MWMGDRYPSSPLGVGLSWAQGLGNRSAMTLCTYWQGETGSVYYSMYNIVCMQGASPIYIPSTGLVGVFCGVCEIQSCVIK